MKVISIQVPPAVEHRPANQLRIAGVTRFTTIDFPGFLSAVVFLKGCPWKCLYCQNPELQLKEFSENEEAVSWDYLENFLKKRIGLIDGVVFSGGEPLTDPALYEAVQTAKKLGYKIGLHTAGMYPHQLREILPFLDWVGLDIKAPLLERDLYEKVVGKRVHIEKVEESLDDLLESGIPFEVRTTAHPDYLSKEQLLALAMQLKERGVREYALQIYREPPMHTQEHPLPRVGSDYPSNEVLKQLESSFDKFTLRRP